MKKLGIFLGFEPNASIKAEGITRLLSFVINAAVADPKIQLTIVLPYWLIDEVIRLLEDNNVAVDKIEIVSNKAKSNFMQFYFRYGKRMKAGRRSSAKSGENFLRNLSYRKILHFSSDSSFFSKVMLEICLMLMLSFLVFYRLVMKLFRYLKKIIKPVIQKIVSLIRFEKNKFFNLYYKTIYSKEIENLVDFVNKKYNIDCWFIPCLFWPEIKLLRGKKVVAAPDIVFFDFPNGFMFDGVKSIFNKMIASTCAADHIICYSDYVKNKHMVDAIGIKPENISIVRHGVTSLQKYLFHPSFGFSEVAKQIIKKYQKQYLCEKLYWYEIDFSECHYIFYSSQLRPYKNIFSLIKAVEYLIRKRGLNVKLVLTADLNANEEISAYLSENRLKNDVLSVYNIPSDALAAFNYFARLSVNPTLFEGGFPFTFCEAYSVGTPSLMSAIPVILETIQSQDLREMMLFDPYDLSEMADKIEWGLNNREKLYASQKALYESLQDWKAVGKEYIKIFFDGIEKPQ